ncbi:MAG: motility protein A [Clostridiaceae bacterium]
MKRDLTTIIGVLAGFGMIFFGISSGGGAIILFLNFPSFIITVGGSFCSLLVNYPIENIKLIPTIFKKSTENLNYSKEDIISQFTEISKKARKDGLLSLEDDIDDIDDEFFKKGLQMVVDGIEPETIKEILELETDEMDRRHEDGAGIFRAWGAYAPAFGMIGTLIGLIIMLANLDDSSAIASGMAAALVTTFYGSVMANIFFNPIAAKLSLKNGKELEIREMVLEGILSIQAGVNPRIIEDKLISYLSPKERILYNNKSNNKGEVAEDV